MKQFIYLDTDTINSIIAQKQKGIVSEFSSEQENSTGIDIKKARELTLDGSVGGGLKKLAKVQAGITGNGSVEHDDYSHNVIKEIVTKTLHDATFDIAYELIKQEENLNCVDNNVSGAFIELSQKFDFVDLAYIDVMFSQNAFVDFLKKNEEDTIKEQLEHGITQELNREQRREREKQLNKEITNRIKENNKKYDEMVDILKAIRQIIPYKRMLVSLDGYLIPLEDKYFRDNPETVAFKHGGKITCVGYITNIIEKTKSDEGENVFSNLHNLVNSALVDFLAIEKEKLYVVHPIAVYYGQ